MSSRQRAKPRWFDAPVQPPPPVYGYSGEKYGESHTEDELARSEEAVNEMWIRDRHNRPSFIGTMTARDYASFAKMA